jgi:hypothetical protein
MRKRHSWRVVVDDATYQTVEDLARRQSRTSANMALFLIKLGLEHWRAQQRPAAERTEPSRP